MSRVKVFTVQKGSNVPRLYLSRSRAFDSLTDENDRFRGIFNERWVLDFEFIEESEAQSRCMDYQWEKNEHDRFVKEGIRTGEFSLKGYQHEE